MTRNAYNILVGNFKLRDHLGVLNVGCRIILKCILNKLDTRVCVDLNHLY
jgi:hypothetical protein